MQILVLRDEKTISFAASELKKYLEALKVEERIDIKNEGDPAARTIAIGTYSDFEEISKMESADSDSFIINIEEGKGIIAGSNPRSVLYGVYTYLKNLGIRWVRPGKDGEHIPQKAELPLSVKIEEEASYHFRGVSAGGAISIENILEQVDWCAKMGYNRIFVELVDPSVCFIKWYDHHNNPKIKAEKITQEQIDNYFNTVADEILKRGMIFQRAGHGFMCEPFGINVKDWGREITDDFKISDSVKEILPQINGERRIHKNTPMITNFCLSNIKARERVVKYTTEYARRHPEAEEIHFWLADGWDNHCECEECRKKLPSDFYVMLLNELDEAFSKENLPNKIVLISYVELLWAPIYEKLKSKDRFLMMFCPITRSNAISYMAENPCSREIFLPEYERNDIDWPMSAAENLGFLKQWQRTQPMIKDYFEFGYHYIWRQYTDFGFYNTARNLCEDVNYLYKAGLNGMVSCQFTRSYFPTGLGLYVFAEVLWDKNKKFDDIAKEYLQFAFGENWEFVQKYLATLSEVSEYSEHRYFPDVPKKYIKKRCHWTRSFMKETLKERTSSKNIDAVYEASWKYLNYHANFLMHFTYLIEALDDNNAEKARIALDNTAEYLQNIEEEIQGVFDVAKFIDKYENIVVKL